MDVSVGGSDLERTVSDVVQVGLYVGNAFRLLELPVDCSEQAIKKRQMMIKMAAKAHLSIAPGTGQALPLGSQKDEYAYNDAAERLLDPQTRFVEEFFWFWPERFGHSDDDDALQALHKGEIDDAIDTWSNRGSHVAIHNLAIYSHFMALETEKVHTGGSLPPSTLNKITTYWSQTYRRWHKLMQDEEHWDHLKGRIRDYADPRLTLQAADDLRELLPYSLLLINARLAVEAADKAAGKETVARHVQIIRGSGFDAATQDKAIVRSLESVVERAKNYVAHAGEQGSANPATANRTAQELIENIGPLLETVDGLLPIDSPVSQSLHDDAVSGVLACIVAYANKTEDWNGGDALLRSIAGLARTGSVRERVAVNQKALDERRQAGNDWCAPGYYAAPANILLQLEEARAKFDVEDFDGAIRVLEGLLPILDWNSLALAHKPLATCLNVRSGKALGQSIARFNGPRRIMMKILARASLPDFAATATALRTGQQAQYAQHGILTCQACGTRILGAFYTMTYEATQYVLCPSCNAEDDLDTSPRRADLVSVVSSIYPDLTRARALDQANASIAGNIAATENIARQLGISLTGAAVRQAPSIPVLPGAGPVPTPVGSGTASGTAPAAWPNPASLASHLFCWLIDSTLIILAFNYLMKGTFGPSTGTILWTTFLYYALFHWLFHRTIGEAITKTRVVTQGGWPAIGGFLAFWRAALCAALIFALVTYWWGILPLLLPVLNRRRAGFQDVLSGTTLVR